MDGGNRDYLRDARALVVLHQDGRDVAINLVWRTVIQAGEKQPAIMAREAGASHYCSVEGTVGYGKLPNTRSGQRHSQTDTNPITSLALLAIRRVGDLPALLALKLGDDKYWLCSFRNGEPAGPEAMVPSRDEFLSIIANAREQAIENDKAFTLFTDALPDSDSEFMSLEELLREPAAPGDVLQPVGTVRASATTGAKRSSGTFKSAFLGLGVPLLLAYGGYSYYQQDQEEKAAIERAEARRKQDKAVISPQEQWNQALQAAIRNRHAADAQLLQALRTSLGKVPVDWIGWQLKTVACTAPVEAINQPSKPANQTGAPRSWACVANYEAPRMQVATNAQLLAALPTGFSPVFIPTTKATLNWKVPHSAAPLDTKVLPSQSQTLIDLGSALQTLTPALSEPPTFAFVPLPDLVAPKDAAGVDLIRPASLETPVMATLNLKGPLRSLDSIIQSGIAADWSSLTVHLSDSKPATNDQTNPSASNTANTNASALNFELTGVVYAKN